jgi:polysaccharide biosynthesis transport protein
MDQPVSRELTIGDYAQALRRRKWLIVIAVVATVGVALALTLIKTPIYEGQAEMLVQPRSTDSLFDPNTGQRNDPNRTLQTEIQVLKSDQVQQRVKDALGLKTDPPDVTGSPIGQTDVVAVKARSTDPRTAQMVADAYVQAYIDFRRTQSVDDLLAASQEIQVKVDQLQQQIDALDQQVAAAPEDQRAALESTLSGQRTALINQQALFKQKLDQLQVDAALRTGGAQMTKPASLPTDPVEPRPLRTGALALVVGLLLGIGGAFLVDHLDDSVTDREDLERAIGGVPILAVIPVDPPPDPRPVAVSKPHDPAVEAYRTLRTSVQFLGIEKPLRVIQVSSSIQAEGKTTTIANLAVMLARAGSNVVLVDADLRRPRLHEVFAVSDGNGLTNALLGDDVLKLVRESGEDHLDVLPAGPVPPNPSELLGSKRMSTVLEQLGEHYDIVLVDSPPILPVTDALVLTGTVDGIILVVQAGRTTETQVRESVNRLTQLSAPIVGVVLNRLSGADSGVYGYGYSYGYSYKPSRPPKERRRDRRRAEEAAEEGRRDEADVVDPENVEDAAEETSASPGREPLPPPLRVEAEPSDRAT